MVKKGEELEKTNGPNSEEPTSGQFRGLKSSELKRKKKDLKDAALALLNATGFRLEDVDEEVDGNTAIILSLFKKALEGNVQAFTAIRDTAGQKFAETVNVNDVRPKSIEIEFVDKSKPRSNNSRVNTREEISLTVGENDET